MPPIFRPGKLGGRQPHQAYDKSRGSAADRGYTREWSRKSGQHKREHPLCVGCLALGVSEPVTVTDHIVPHRGDEVLFWDRSNWQSACNLHHSQVKQKLEAMWDKGTIKPDALRLDSPMALRLSKQLPQFWD